MVVSNLLCPSKVLMTWRLTPVFSRCVAKLWRNVCAVNGLSLKPAFVMALFSLSFLLLSFFSLFFFFLFLFYSFFLFSSFFISLFFFIFFPVSILYLSFFPFPLLFSFPFLSLFSASSFAFISDFGTATSRVIKFVNLPKSPTTFLAECVGRVGFCDTTIGVCLVAWQKSTVHH